MEYCCDQSLVARVLIFIQILKNVLLNILNIFYLHYFTITSGICASQIYVACQNGRVDQALSLGFLLCWIAGDLANFIGCYLTNQLPIQVICQYSYLLIYSFQTVSLKSRIT